MLSVKGYVLVISWMTCLQIALDIAYWLYLFDLQNKAFLVRWQDIPDYLCALIEVICLTAVTMGIIIFLGIRVLRSNQVKGM